MTGPYAQSQLGETGAYGETDLTVALLGFVRSLENRSALGTALLSSSSRARAHVAWPVYSRNDSWSPEEVPLGRHLFVRFLVSGD